MQFSTNKSISFIILIFILFFYKIIFDNYLAYTGDFMTMSLPWKYFLYQTIENYKTFPIYNPNIFCGLPFAANIQAAVFYPIDFIFYFVEPLTAFKITFFINYLS